MYAVNNAFVSKSQINLKMTVFFSTTDCTVCLHFFLEFTHIPHIKYTFSLIPGYFTICNTIFKVVGTLTFNALGLGCFTCYNSGLLYF